MSLHGVKQFPVIDGSYVEEPPPLEGKVRCEKARGFACCYPQSILWDRLLEDRQMTREPFDLRNFRGPRVGFITGRGQVGPQFLEQAPAPRQDLSPFHLPIDYPWLRY